MRMSDIRPAGPGAHLPEDVKTDGLYVPSKKKAKDMTREELQPALNTCMRSRGKTDGCRKCSGCPFGKRAIELEDSGKG